MHVHVEHAQGDAKSWLEPHIELAVSYRLDARRIAIALRLVQENEDEIRKAWNAHFRR